MAKSKQDAPTKAPTIESKISERIEKSEAFQSVDNWKQNSERILNYIEGKYYKAGYDTKYVINTMYSLVNLLVPNLYFQNPNIRCTPKRRWIIKEDGSHVDAYKAAQLHESFINKVLKDIHFEVEMRKIVQDILVYGFGVMKVGYAGKTDITTDNEKTDFSDLFAYRICPLDFLPDPMCTGMEDARYAIHRIVKTLEDVQNNDNYKNTKDLKGSSFPDSSPKKDLQEKSHDTGEWCVLYEHHDLDKNTIQTFVKEGKAVLWDRKNPHDMVGSHFVVFKFTGDIDSFRGLSPLLMVEDEALAVNDAISLQMNHMEQFPGVIMYEESFLDKDEIESFQNLEQGSILKTQPGGLEGDKVRRLPPLPAGMDYFSALNALYQATDRVLGVGDFQRAPQSGKRKSATEISAEVQAAGVRRDFFLSFIKKGVLDVVQKLSELAMQYYDHSKLVIMEGEYSEDIKFSTKDIKQDLDYDFDIEALKAYSPSRAQALIQYIQVIGQTPALAPILQRYDPAKIADIIAKNMDIDPKELERVSPITHLENDPYEENALAAAKQRIPDPHPSEPHEIHLPIHTAGYAEQVADKNNEGAQELQRHIQMTEYMAQIAGILPGQAQSPPQQAAPNANVPSNAEAMGQFTAPNPTSQGK